MIPLYFEFTNIFMRLVFAGSILVLLGLVIVLITAVVSMHIDNRRRLQEFVDECARLDAARRKQTADDDNFWGAK